ncbi:protein UXT homolog [Dendroctonus ponderosae]
MDINGKLKEYECFIEDKLKRDLRDIELLLNSKAAQCEEWNELKTMVGAIKDHRTKDRDMQLQFELGNGVAAFGSISDYETTFVDVGLGYLLEMQPNEAGKYADIRLRLLQKEMLHLRELAVGVKVRIKMVLLAIGELQASLNR